MRFLSLFAVLFVLGVSAQAAPAGKPQTKPVQAAAAKTAPDQRNFARAAGNRRPTAAGDQAPGGRGLHGSHRQPVRRAGGRFMDHRLEWGGLGGQSQCVHFARVFWGLLPRPIRRWTVVNQRRPRCRGALHPFDA